MGLRVRSLCAFGIIFIQGWCSFLVFVWCSGVGTLLMWCSGVGASLVWCSADGAPCCCVFCVCCFYGKRFVLFFFCLV